VARLTRRSVDFSKWYNEVISRSQLADYSPVKGCMVIRPNGYAIWERMQRILDDMIKDTGARNAYFPLFIPESYFQREAEHVEGFAPECAVVTHGGGKKLEENLMIRPTSETIIYGMFSKWINSYRDLPLMINQWANIVRWEMRTRLFLRTTEFLWQEGHTAHATFEEADNEALLILDMYKDFSENFLALPTIKGRKSQKQKFAGALYTYCIEAMMGDKKSLQCGTSHNLGQNFAKAFNVRFQNVQGHMEYVWQTSWGVSTRMIGALIMAHGDDNGLIIPPLLAPIQVIIIPIAGGTDKWDEIIKAAYTTKDILSSQVHCHIDDREHYTPGWKFNEWELQGVPLRIEIGPKDVEKKCTTIVRRDTGEKQSIPQTKVSDEIPKLLDDIQKNMYKNALAFQQTNTELVDSYKRFKEIMNEEERFLQCHWCGNQQCEDSIQDETKAIINVIPFESIKEKGRCIYCGKESSERVIFAKSY